MDAFQPQAISLKRSFVSQEQVDENQKKRGKEWKEAFDRVAGKQFSFLIN